MFLLDQQLDLCATENARLDTLRRQVIESRRRWSPAIRDETH